MPLDEGVRVINTLCEKIITLDFVSGDNVNSEVVVDLKNIESPVYIINILPLDEGVRVD
jgi:hypothetical protein